MPPASSNDGDVGVAFRRLLQDLGRLSDVVDREAADGLERAEAYRHLSRLFSACEEWFLQKADPDRPAFTREMTPWRKFIGDNPDRLYDVASVAPETAYRTRST